MDGGGREHGMGQERGPPTRLRSSIPSSDANLSTISFSALLRWTLTGFLRPRRRMRRTKRLSNPAVSATCSLADKPPFAGLPGDRGTCPPLPGTSRDLYPVGTQARLPGIGGSIHLIPSWIGPRRCDFAVEARPSTARPRMLTQTLRRGGGKRYAAGPLAIR